MDERTLWLRRAHRVHPIWLFTCRVWSLDQKVLVWPSPPTCAATLWPWRQRREEGEEEKREERGDLATSLSIVAVPLQKSVRLSILSLFSPNSDLFLTVHGGAPMSAVGCSLGAVEGLPWPSLLGKWWEIVVGIVAVAFVALKGKP